jgi:hypothetical protein
MSGMGHPRPGRASRKSADVRYAPIATKFRGAGDMTRCANNRLMHPQQISVLFDHLVGGRDKIGWKRKPKGVGGPEIDDEIELR